MSDAFATGSLSPVLRAHSVHVGGAAFGRGLRRSARYFLRTSGRKRAEERQRRIASLSPHETNSTDFTAATLPVIPEDPFYVCDLGVVVSQLCQWKKHFPRVEPFYAVKCNPDRAVVSTLAALGANFDCASIGEIYLVREVAQELNAGNPERVVRPDIIYANPCKQPGHIAEGSALGVSLTTFDNSSELEKIARICPQRGQMRLVLRIATDDAGAQCRLSSKFGARREQWRPLLELSKRLDLEVVGVSFHVGSGCRDAGKYGLALRDARDVFDLAEREFGFRMTLLDIGGGFPGESHSLWNPSSRDPEGGWPEDDVSDVSDVDSVGTNDVEGHEVGHAHRDADAHDRFMFFSEIADHVAPELDRLFPRGGGVRVIAEPGRYFVAASSALVVSVTSVRENAAPGERPVAISDAASSRGVDALTRRDEEGIVGARAEKEKPFLSQLVEELVDYSHLFARQSLANQEVDVYTDKGEAIRASALSGGLLAPPEERGPGSWSEVLHTVEGMSAGLVVESLDVRSESRSESRSEPGSESQSLPQSSVLSLAAAGEAAVAGVVAQAAADSGALQDSFAYYVNDGVYGAFNNLMFDHATVRPRHLRRALGDSENAAGDRTPRAARSTDGIWTLEEELDDDDARDDNLFTSTVFGPTCDSIDVIGRSVLLPQLRVGDWLYFNNMGAYTSAAASSFNGFAQTEKFYVCSVLPEAFEELVRDLEGEGDET
jgi:ornithine decarboxylase